MLRETMMTVFIAGSLIAVSAVSAQARDNCEKSVRKAEDNLRKEVLRHGEFSPQARYRRHQLEAARERCGQAVTFRDRDRHHDWDRDADRDQRRHRRHKHDRDRDRDNDRDRG